MEKIVESPYQVKSIVNKLERIPYGIDLIKTREAWEKSNKGESIIVAVIDTGCDFNHPDLEEAIIDGYNFTTDDNGDVNIYMDYRGHGTHVAGIIAARENNQGIIGVAPKSQLLVLKTIDKNGKGNLQNVIKAINYAIRWNGPKNQKVSIINMSLGGVQHFEELYEVIKEARKKGVLIVAAAGNDGDGRPDTQEISYPGFYQEVIQVGSINEDLTLSSYSNTNINLDFVAPGGAILSTFLNGQYALLSGTSMAAPYVSGALALILNLHKEHHDPVISSFLSYSYLFKHAKKLGNSYLEEGNGLIQLA
ncbi:S8 family peptidase [Psychrobacillus sp. MER TA 171]|uniref:S8 family peptidase n=1 Tax=Psychrobacillus sp. MER TA 171 TaxID=2939577 RepID=UPI00203A7061|nr:S8 family peptidase [Psychrobacillus sp. MER TA 171]MCM3358148.1 S8 family peptidase [Psychrobacillus sp. MER TA 171]